MGGAASGLRQLRASELHTFQRAGEIARPPSSPPTQFQSSQCPRAGSEPVGFDAQALEHAHIEIAQWRRILRIEGKMLAVLEAAASEKDRQVLSRMAAAVAKVTAEKNGRAVEQTHAVFMRLFELRKQIADGLHRFHLDDLELRKLVRILAVMRQVMMPEAHSLDWRSEGGTGEHDRNEPGRIGLESQMCEVKEQTRATDEVGGAGDVLRRLDVHLELGCLGPAFGIDHPLLQFADAGKVFVELVAVVAAEISSQRLRLVSDVIENAAAVFEPAHLALDFLGTPFKQQAREDFGRRVVCRDERTGASP